jgi:arginine exporter protein ArgO
MISRLTISAGSFEQADRIRRKPPDWFPVKGEREMVSTNRTAATRSSLQKAALAVGVVFLLVGVLGFIPGITTDYAAQGFAGHESGALLLGVFQVSVLHNVVHLLFGVLGLLMARTAGHARNYLLFGGIVYLVLWVYGLVVGHDTPVNFVPVNNADNWLHLILGIGMIALALVLSRSPDRRAPATR